MKRMLWQAMLSPKLQEATIVQEIKPFKQPRFITTNQEFLKGGLVVDDMYLYSKEDLQDNIILYQVEYSHKIKSCPSYLAGQLRFNFVSKPYFVKSHDEDDTKYYVKCFPNANNMIQRCFNIWRKTTENYITHSLRKKLLRNLDILKYKIKPLYDEWNHRLLSAQKSLECIEQVANFRLYTKAEAKEQNMKQNELLTKEKMLQEKIEKQEMELKVCLYEAEETRIIHERSENQ